MSLFGWLFGKKEATAKHNNLKVNDWRTQEIQLMMLSRFLTPRNIENGVPEHWSSELGASVKDTINSYIKNGLLINAHILNKVEYCNTTTSLKSMLKERGLKLSGKKQELAERLVAADEQGMITLHKSQTVMVCSPACRTEVAQYVADKEQEFNDMINISLEALRARDFEKASRTVGTFEKKQLNLPSPEQVAISIPSRPREVSVDVKELQEIFTIRPKILSELAESEWEPLHVVTGLTHLLGGRSSSKWLPEGFKGVSKFDIEVTLRMMMFHIGHLSDIKRARSIGITKGTIRGCGSASCEACQQIANKVNKIEALPELPYEKCTCVMGCRCYLEPEINF